MALRGWNFWKFGFQFPGEISDTNGGKEVSLRGRKGETCDGK